MDRKNIYTTLSLAGLIVLIGLVGFYLLPGQQAVIEPPNYFEFTVFNQDLPEDKIEKFTQRFSDARASLEVDFNDFQAWLLLASAKKQVGDYKGAEDAWIKAGETRPLNSTSFNNLADLYTNFTKEYDKAEEAWMTAVSNSSGEPQNPGFYRNFYSFYLYNLEDLDKAEAILLEAININPHASDLLALLGYFYRDERGDDVKATEYFEKTLLLNPGNTQVRQDLSKLR